MSVLVALKIEGRLAGAILTVLFSLDVTTRKDVEANVGGGIYFSGRAKLPQAELAILAHKFDFCGEPRQGWAIGAWWGTAGSSCPMRRCLPRDSGTRNFNRRSADLAKRGPPLEGNRPSAIGSKIWVAWLHLQRQSCESRETGTREPRRDARHRRDIRDASPDTRPAGAAKPHA